MRLLHCADLHLGVTRYGYPTPTGNSRIADFAATARLVVDVAKEERADAVLFAGDTFNSRRPGPEELAAIARVLSDLSSLGIRTVVLPGNHDGMTTIGDPTTHALLWLRHLDLPLVDVLTRPGPYTVSTRSGPFRVFALPYPHKRALDKELGDMPYEERVEETGRRLEQAILTLGLREEGMPNVFLGHLSVAGASLGSEASMRFGWDVIIRPDVLGRFDYAALGHIHKQQQVGEKAWYAGAPEYIDFGEATQEKGFLLAEVTEGYAPKVQHIPSDCRRMRTIDAEQQPDGRLVASVKESWAHAIVKVTIHCQYERPSAKTVADLIRVVRAGGASFVKTDTVLDLPGGATRQPIDAATETSEALRQWLVANGQPEEPTLTVGRDMVASLSD